MEVVVKKRKRNSAVADFVAMRFGKCGELGKAQPG
jgi:hypothetical protein